ncbi:hypothetical protein GFJ94_05695 [Flavobacterium sp. LMO8]|uniref:restriction endonuclease subunit S n=1 Tax=Flavobacterium sp. LMO8 TaxID=2654244 RepID=UPI0012919392|nr:restriction endonuclease subunit S [Flavobacterium sp. LMO8]MQP24551.1 hypothetical protein [Flavobacterium sp. LMO8]
MSWENKTLGDLLIIKGGKRLPKGCEFITKPNNHLYIRARDIKDGKIDVQEPAYIDENTFIQISNYIVNKDDIVITIVGANIGDIGEITEEFDGCNLTENAVKLIPHNLNELYPKFLKYSIYGDYQKNKFQQIASGSAQGKLGIYKIKTFEIEVPKIETQKRIASILSNYDDLLENNLKRIKLLEKTAQNIYKEWFVNFRFPNYENTAFDKESGLPVGWSKLKVIDFFDFVKGIEVGSKNYLNDEAINTIPFLRVGDISKRDSGIFVYQELVKDKTVDVNDILISFDGSIGNIGYGLFGAYSSGLRKILDKNDSFGKTFSLCLMKSDEIQQTIKAHAKGSTILHAGSSIQYLEFVKPSDEILRKYKNLNEPFFDEIINLTVQNQKLKEARDILLPRLMNRTIEV